MYLFNKTTLKKLYTFFRLCFEIKILKNSFKFLSLNSRKDNEILKFVYSINLNF